MDIRRWSVVAWVALFAAGCAAPKPVVSRVIVANRTGSIVRDVSVLHEPTMRKGAASAILPDRELEIGFAEREMLATSAVVQWSDDGGRREQRVLLPTAVPPGMENPLVLRYRICNSGVDVGFTPAIRP